MMCRYRKQQNDGNVYCIMISTLQALGAVLAVGLLASYWFDLEIGPASSFAGCSVRFGASGVTSIWTFDPHFSSPPLSPGISRALALRLSFPRQKSAKGKKLRTFLRAGYFSTNFRRQEVCLTPSKKISALHSPWKINLIQASFKLKRRWHTLCLSGRRMAEGILPVHQ